MWYVLAQMDQIPWCWVFVVLCCALSMMLAVCVGWRAAAPPLTCLPYHTLPHTVFLVNFWRRRHRCQVLTQYSTIHFIGICWFLSVRHVVDSFTWQNVSAQKGPSSVSMNWNCCHSHSPSSVTDSDPGPSLRPCWTAPSNNDRHWCGYDNIFNSLTLNSI